MILEVPYKIGDTVSLKLLSGEEVIGRLDDEKNDMYKMHKPMMLVQTQDGLGLAPFMFSASPDTPVSIKQSAVSCVIKSDEGVAKSYTQQTAGILT